MLRYNWISVQLSTPAHGKKNPNDDSRQSFCWWNWNVVCMTKQMAFACVECINQSHITPGDVHDGAANPVLNVLGTTRRHSREVQPHARLVHQEHEQQPYCRCGSTDGQENSNDMTSHHISQLSPTLGPFAIRQLLWLDRSTHLTAITPSTASHHKIS